MDCKTNKFRSLHRSDPCRTARGLELFTYVDGEKHWQDICVVNSRHGPSFPSDWIEYDPELNIVWLKGQRNSLKFRASRGVNYPALIGLISWIGQNADIRIK